MEIWVKMASTDLVSTEAQVIVAAGNSKDGGKGGFYIYMVGKKLTVHIGTADEKWVASKNIPATILADEWFNVGFRWNQTSGIGLQVFINGELLEEIPFSSDNPPAEMPADNKLYVGCRKVGFGTSLQDFTDFELDELAFWGKYLPNKQLKLFTGSLIPNDEIEVTIFSYEDDLVELVAEPLSTGNPYYEIADVYIPCDERDFANESLINTTRGSETGLLLDALPSATLELPRTNGIEVSDLKNSKQVSFSFWIYPDIEETHSDQQLFVAASWEVVLKAGNITFTGQYSTSVGNDSYQNDIIIEETYSIGIPLQIWTNFGFSFRTKTGFDIYINGIKKNGDAIYTEKVLSSLSTDNDVISVMKSQGGEENITVNDIIIWKRYLYDYESYRFMGFSPSEAYLDTHTDMFWSTDYYAMTDKAAMHTLLPLYKTVNSTVKTVTVTNAEVPGQTNKGQAMEISENNGWVMLGLEPYTGSTDPMTGSEFSGTCLSDPSQCADGLTLALWLKLVSIPNSNSLYYVITSGEEDEMSRGFSIYLYKKDLVVALVDGEKYWKVTTDDGKYPAGKWFHLAFTWKSNEGLWVFLNGELIAANIDGVAHSRPTDRYNRITLGRNNANNAFGGYLNFLFQEIAVYKRFTVTYRIREIFALADNHYYEQANYYYNKDTLITSTLSSLQAAGNATPALGPHGIVEAGNNTIALNEGATIILEHFETANCVMQPSKCSKGLTVTTWSRNNFFLQKTDSPIYIVSSHGKPESVMDGTLEGWTIYYIEGKFMVTLVSGTTKFNMTISELAKPLLPQRWTNIGFTWSADIGMTILMDGQVAGIMKNGYTVSPQSFNSFTDYYLMVGHVSHLNNTFFGIYNLAIWEKYYFGSRAYELTGHEVDVIAKYSAADLMWSFDGPIHEFNNKYDEMVMRKETYDSSLTGAALEVTRDGLNNASLGNYSSECVTEPSSCKAGFQLGLQLKLQDYTPGEVGDDKGAILMLGSPDANFEGVAILQLKEDEENKILVLVVNDLYTFERTIPALLDQWFDMVVGWNVQDGIAIKVNNKKVSGPQSKVKLPIGSSKLITNKLTMGVGSGGGTNQGVDAAYNDISLTYNSKVTVEQEGRCYESAALYYRLNKGQIFTMDHVVYLKDREDIVESAFYMSGRDYIELDNFVDHCFADPSLCTDGLSLSFYVKVVSVINETSQTLLSSGTPDAKGYSVSVESRSTEGEGSEDGIERAKVSVMLSNGKNKWTVNGAIVVDIWTSVGFTWSDTDLGLSLFVDETYIGSGKKTGGAKSTSTRNNLVIGRGNAADSVDYADAIFDDVGIWDIDLRSEEMGGTPADPYPTVGVKLMGKKCDEGDLLVEAEQLLVIETTLANITEVTDKPLDCQFYDKDTEFCAEDVDELQAHMANGTFPLKLNKLGDVLVEWKYEVAKFQPNSTNTKEDLNQQVHLFRSFTKLEIDTVVDPREAQDILEKIIDITDNLLNPSTWSDAWSELDTNSTKGPANFLGTVEEMSLKITRQLYLGLDKEDDCTVFKTSSKNIVASNAKIRLKLCDEEYIYPSYNKLYKDPKVNATLEAWNRPTDTVVIPQGTWPKHEYPDDTIIAVSVLLFKDIDELMPGRKDVGAFINLEATTSADNPEAAKDPKLVEEATINSKIMAISAYPPVPEPLEECIVITLEHLEDNEDSRRSTYCAFWEPKFPGSIEGIWSGEGCSVDLSNKTHTVCCCYHMTSFAILIEPPIVDIPDTLSQKITMIVYVCNGLSIFSLLLFCCIVLCCKALRSERYMIHLNLSIGMIFAHGSFILVDFTNEETPILCKIAAISQHFFYMVAYAWILIEALWLFYAVTYGTLMGKMRCYAVLGWVVPAGIVILTVSLYLDKYGLNERCWITYNDYLIMAMLAPILFCIFLNGAALLIIICNLPQPTLKREDILSEVRWAVLYAMLLVPVLIFIWTLATLDIFKIEISETMSLVYTAMFSLQGFFVFLVYGVGQRSVRLAVMRKKYEPNYPSSALLSHRGNSFASSGDVSQTDSGYVEVKPQPLSRPSSRSSKDKSSPRPPSPNASTVRVKTAIRSSRRRPSTVSAESAGDNSGYIP